MGQGPDEAFPLLGLPAARSQRGTEKPLVPTEGTLDLPSLAVTFEVLAVSHFSSVLGQRPFPGSLAVSASGNDRGRDAELLTAEHMVVFCVVALVAEEPVDWLIGRCLAHCRRELRGINARAHAHVDAQPEMTLKIADRRELRIRQRRVTTSLSPHVIATHVSAL